MRTPLCVAFLVPMFLLGLQTGCIPNQTEDDSADATRSNSFLAGAQKAFEDGTYRHALALTDSAEHYAPDQPKLHFIRGRILSELRRFDQAEKAYEKVLALDADYEGVWFNLGNNALRQGRQRKALSLYRKELASHSSANAHLYTGRAYAELGRTDSALQELHRAVELDSGNAKAYAYLGQVYKNAGQPERALTYSKKALTHAPSNLDYRYVVGSQLLQTGRTAEAIDALEVVTTERPWHYGALYNFGQALAREGRTEEAQSYFVKADSAQKLQARIDQLQETARLNPNRSRPWIDLGKTLYQANRPREAKQALDRALFIDPQNLALQNNVANLAHDLGNTREAIERYRTVLKRDSTLADVWLNLGIVYVDNGQREAARRAWETALQYAPDDPSLRQYLDSLSSTAPE